MAKHKVNSNTGDRKLTEKEATGYIAAIVQRTRRHPEIVRGASVRGALALKQVLEGFARIGDKGQTCSGLEKAAMITLPPRISTRQGSNNSAEAIIRAIVRDVLYGKGKTGKKRDSKQKKETRKLSLEEFMTALQNLSLSRTLGEDEYDEDDGNIEIIADDTGPGGSRASNMERDSRYKEKKNWFPSLEKALKELMGELEQKLINGEISESDYRYQKKKLEDMLGAASYLESGATDNQIAETVMELMEAGDKQWQKELDFQDMYVYYHIRESRKDDGLAIPKQNWYALKVIVDFLESQDMIKSNEEGTSFFLTEQAIGIVLKNLLSVTPKQDGKKESSRTVSKHASERSQDTRRYVTGDVFRDISIRRTMKEIARRRRKSSEINRHDLRIFLKEHRQPNSDIMLCVDSSGSMGFHRKLILARLAAAAITKNAISHGDRVGVVTFDDMGRSVITPTEREEAVMRNITGIASGGNTNIGDGLKCAGNLLKRERSRNRKVIVLITDGEPTAITQKALNSLQKIKNRDMTGEYAVLEARAAASSGIETSVIWITDGKEAGKKLVESIAKAGHGEVKRILRPDDLKSIVV